MTLFVEHRLSDGTIVVRDNVDQARFVVKASAWPAIAALPAAEQRAAVEAAVLAARADPTGGRTQAEEEAIETARNASSGEAHQDGGRI